MLEYLFIVILSLCTLCCYNCPQCQMHGWKNCRQKTTELLDKASNISVEHRKCLTSAVLARVSSLSVNPLASLQADDSAGAADVPVPGANEASQTLTGNNAQPQTSEESSETCTLNGQSKVIALMVRRVALCEAMYVNGAPYSANKQSIQGVPFMQSIP